MSGAFYHLAFNNTAFYADGGIADEMAHLVGMMANMGTLMGRM